MYTNWPFTAKNKHKQFTCPSFAKRRFSTETEREQCGVQTNDQFPRSVYDSQLSKQGNRSLPPTPAQSGRTTVEERAEPQLKRFRMKLQGRYFSAHLGRAQTSVLSELLESARTVEVWKRRWWKEHRSREESRLTWTFSDASNDTCLINFMLRSRALLPSADYTVNLSPPTRRFSPTYQLKALCT